MTVLEFLADVVMEEGEVEATEESMTCLNNNESQREYYFVVKRDGKFFYQYISIYPKEGKKGQEKYAVLMDLLFINSDEEECSIIQALLRTKIKGRVEGLREITMKYPMYSVRGTCSKNCVECKGTEQDIVCCENGEMGFTGTVGYKYPSLLELLSSVLELLRTCPKMEGIFVLHDFYPLSMEKVFFVMAFRFGKNLIEVFDADEAKRLYEEYQEKYPYDTRKVDKWLEDLYSL